MRKLPEGPSMSRAHIPFGKIGFWPDRQTDTDRHRHRTNKEIRALLYNSPFGAIIKYCKDNAGHELPLAVF